MDPITIATTVVAFLAPYLAEGGKAAAKKGGEAIIAALERKFKGKPAAEEALADLKADPQDEDNQAILEAQLKKALKNDAALLAKLARLLETADVHITGDGNVIGDGSSAVFAKGHSIAVGGDFVARDKIVHELPQPVLTLFARQFGFDPFASDAGALRAYFNNVIFERHSKLSFLFIRPDTGKVYTETDVETVFVPLRITNPEAARRRERGQMERFGRAPDEEETRPVTLPELLNKYDCFLLRGKPGSGKTTLLRHVALAFARGEQREKLNWQGKTPLPLLVPLRNLGAFLKQKKYVDPQPRALLEYLEEHLRGAQVGFSPDFLSRRLDSGQCLLLLDALDEVAGVLDGGGDLRKEVARQVAAFIEHYRPRGNHFVLTSRPRAYREEGAIRQALPQPEICDVLDLSTEGYGRLTTNLLVVLTGDEAQGRAEAEDLLARIAPNKQLSDLAGNPLLCTTLVLVYKYRGRKLPERRVDVLHEIVTLLLGRWEEERRNVTAAEQLALMGTPEHATEQAIRFRRRALSALAWHMQQTSAAEIAAGEAARTLAAFYRDEKRGEDAKARDWADEFLLVAHERSGLFIALDEGLHAFAHQAFREYLAATYLVNQGEQALLDEVLRHAPAPDEWWEQVVLLAGAHPLSSEGAAGRLVGKLLKQDDVEYAYLAARCAHDMTDQLPGRQRKALQDWLLAALRDASRPAQERARAGRALALAGDPRFRADAWFLPADPLLGFVHIPAGPFLMGSSDADRMAYDGEKPQHEVNLPEYYIARYPVTVAQFRAFVQESGHTPEDEDSLRDPDNHPVQYVTWYEAIKYCNWLTERLREWSETPEPLRTLLRVGAGGGPPWRVTLLSEAEWEKAASWAEEQGSGGAEGRGGKRRYPWGDEPDPNRANYDDTGIGTTSAVGCFPGGASPYGVEDLSGNVLEWTRSLWGTGLIKPDFGYPYDPGDGRENLEAGGDVRRVLRGGSFGSIQWYVRCASRSGSDPRVILSGFRVAVVGSPFPL